MFVHVYGSIPHGIKETTLNHFSYSVAQMENTLRYRVSHLMVTFLKLPSYYRFNLSGLLREKKIVNSIGIIHVYVWKLTFSRR